MLSFQFFSLLFVSQLHDDSSVEDRWNLVLYVVLELFNFLLTLVLEGCKVKIELPLMLFYLILQIQLLLTLKNPPFNVHVLSHPQLVLFKVQRVSRFPHHYCVQKTKFGQILRRLPQRVHKKYEIAFFFFEIASPEMDELSIEGYFRVDRMVDSIAFRASAMCLQGEKIVVF